MEYQIVTDGIPNQEGIVTDGIPNLKIVTNKIVSYNFIYTFVVII